MLDYKVRVYIVFYKGDTGSVSGFERSSGEETGNPLQYSCLGNPMDRGVWLAVAYRVTKIRHDLLTKEQLVLFWCEF